MRSEVRYNNEWRLASDGVDNNGRPDQPHPELKKRRRLDRKALIWRAYNYWTGEGKPKSEKKEEGIEAVAKKQRIESPSEVLEEKEKAEIETVAKKQRIESLLEILQ